MTECLALLSDYGLRSIGVGAELLPRSDISLCQQVVLIGSGMLWNVYFATLALLAGFGFSTVLALAKNSHNGWLRIPSTAFVYFFRGTPLFIQFFFAYEIFVQLPEFQWQWHWFGKELSFDSHSFSRAWLGALIVLFLNTSAYSAEIFYGALRALPSQDIEAAKAYGLSPSQTFFRITWPTLLRLSWSSYTNEAIFLFHATTLVFLSAFPSWNREGDSLYYAKYFADVTFNPFVTYPIVAAFFIVFSLLVMLAFGRINKRLNQHLDH